MPTPHPWEAEAANWIRWARTPEHDIFPYLSPSFFDEIVPDARGLTLEIGCGEGRVTRELASRAHSLVALDASPALVRAARDADPHSAYLVASATALPFRDEAFQAAVAYNVLQAMADASDMPEAVREAARVLEVSGRFCLCVAHPMTDAGLIEWRSDQDDPILSGSYFERRSVNETVTKDGLEMTFHGWTYTLEDYTRALEDAGLLIERVREPAPTEEQAAKRPGLAGWRRLPLFLFVRAVKRRGG